MKVAVPKSHWQPLILGFVGIVLILKPDLDGVEIWHLVGLVSGLSLALSMVGTRALSSSEPASVILFYYYLISFLCSLPLAILEWQVVPLWTLPYLFYIGFSIAL
ncbi:MAG: EamA/RhaT family transporter, partial [Endozoicomonas sp.]